MTLRAEAAQRRRRLQAMIGAGLAVVVVLVGVVLLVSLTGTDKKNNKTAASASTSPTSCRWKPLVDPSTSPKPEMPAGIKEVGTPPASGEPRTGTQTMTITTNLGAIKIEMDLAKTPCTAASFTHLAGKHFFDNSACHRLVAGIHALQCGDPGGQGTGGPTYRFANEYLPTDRRPAYAKGSVAMANGGAQSPDSNGSQFFFLFDDVDSQQLSPDYTLWGKVTAGLDIIEKVAAGGDDGAYEPQPGGGHPKMELKFLSVTVSAPNKA
ncbi:MAG TPA: peptidylprolyl isomerase [Planosporangium sp.]|nr:peptidylprolyl isomerase [Planosporangium sp.]